MTEDQSKSHFCMALRQAYVFRRSFPTATSERGIFRAAATRLQQMFLYKKGHETNIHQPRTVPFWIRPTNPDHAPNHKTLIASRKRCNNPRGNHPSRVFLFFEII